MKGCIKKGNPKNHGVPCPDAKEFDCDERFWSTEEAKRHSRSVHKKDRVPCPYTEEDKCPQTFDSVGHANKHARSIHENVRYPCPVPKEHAERAHPTKDAWPCPVAEKFDCPKTFSSNHKAMYHAHVSVNLEIP